MSREALPSPESLVDSSIRLRSFAVRSGEVEPTLQARPPAAPDQGERSGALEAASGIEPLYRALQALA